MKPDFIGLVRFAEEASPDPCQHIKITTYAANGFDFPTQGQTGNTDERFDAIDIGNAGSEPHAEADDYIRLSFGLQAGEYRKVVTVNSNNRVTLQSAWSVNQIVPTGFQILRVFKTVNQTIVRDELWDEISEEDRETMDTAILKLQAATFSETPAGTRSQVIAKININPVDIRML